MHTAALSLCISRRGYPSWSPTLGLIEVIDK